jgi:2-polyprenyl-3-methyl-5-hydroxy-6-metoxy-1,4-benzoquinol methylase
VKERPLQQRFSQQHPEAMFDAASRGQKARKAVAILADCRGGLRELDLLEIGCSAGYGTVVYAEAFRSVTGVDIDEPALRHARSHNARPNLRYLRMDSQHTSFPDACFDAAVCTHIYEHVPDATRLMQEIHRLLRPGGVCFFSAGNRLCWTEPHYRLPLLSVLPKFLAHRYLRLLGRGSTYYENHLTYWGLEKLVSGFERIDYTIRVVQDPERFDATDVVRPGSVQQRLSLLALSAAYWACPTYLWVLRKPG